MTYILNDGLWSADIKADTLEEAKKKADKELSYTQRTMALMENGLVVACRRWYPTLEGIEDCKKPMPYGSYGYYGDWEEV